MSSYGSFRPEHAGDRAPFPGYIALGIGFIVIVCTTFFLGDFQTTQTLDPPLVLDIQPSAQLPTNENSVGSAFPALHIMDAVRANRSGVLETTLHLGISDSVLAGYSLYCFNQEIPGSVLVLSPGDLLVVHYVNDLEGAPDTTVNTTSLHVHGMHVSPGGVADNVFLAAPPGKQQTHIIHVPTNHALGLNWLHPHFHGSTTLQTGFAAARPILVVDAKAKEKELDVVVLVVQHIPALTGHGHDIDKAQADAGFPMLNKDPNPHPKPRAQNRPRPRVVTLVNGGLTPRATSFDSGITRFALVNTAADGTLVLRLASASSCACTFTELAWDGIRLPHGRPGRHVLAVAPGARAEFMVTCDVPNDTVEVFSSIGPGPTLQGSAGGACGRRHAQASQQHLQNVKAYLGDTYIIDTSLLMLSGRSADKDTATTVTTTAGLEEGLRDLMQYKGPVNRVELSMDNVFVNGEKMYGVNGEHYMNGDLPAFSIELGSVQEWVIVNTNTETHPFHVHTNKFQVTAVQGPTGDDFAADLIVGDFRDTILLPAPGNVTIRFAPSQFTGVSVLHCHVLSHSDKGMIMAFKIVD